MLLHNITEELRTPEKKKLFKSYILSGTSELRRSITQNQRDANTTDEGRLINQAKTDWKISLKYLSLLIHPGVINFT